MLELFNILFSDCKAFLIIMMLIILIAYMALNIIGFILIIKEEKDNENKH